MKIVINLRFFLFNINYNIRYEKQIMKKTTLNEFIEREVKSLLKEEIIKSKKKDIITKKINYLFENSNSSQLDKLEKLIEVYFKKEQLNEGWKSAIAGAALGASSLLGMNNKADAQSFGSFNKDAVPISREISSKNNSDSIFIDKNQIEFGYPKMEPKRLNDTVYRKDIPGVRWVAKNNTDGDLDWYKQKLQRGDKAEYKTTSMGQAYVPEKDGYIVQNGYYYKWVQTSQDRHGDFQKIEKNKFNSEQKPKHTKLRASLDICGKNKATCHSYD
jgi:hypothetical protein